MPGRTTTPSAAIAGTMSRAWRRVCRAAIVLGVAAAPALAIEASAPAIEAAYLYKFGYFVKWPDAAFASSDSPLVLCIVGADPFGAMLDDTVKGQKIGTRPILLRRMSAVARDSGCHIAYITGGGGTAEALAALRGSDVLTVTDAKGGDLGIINFVIKDDRVRFDIDAAAAASGGLEISSRLLNLALAVRRVN